MEETIWCPKIKGFICPGYLECVGGNPCPWLTKEQIDGMIAAIKKAEENTGT